MKSGKRLRSIVMILLITGFAVWGGFRLWLLTQPEDFQAMIRAMPVSEFWRFTYEAVVPRKAPDTAGFGRRSYPERGHSPWILRSSLDGRGRMLNLALAPNLWLSYHTESASPYQLWRGDLDFAGPVYDTYHGREPASRGEAYFRRLDVAWRVYADGKWQTPTVRYLGHSLRESGVELRYRLAHGNESWEISERPELDAGAGAENAVILRRYFSITGNVEALGLQDVEAADELSGLIVDDRNQLRFEAPTAILSQRFSRSAFPIVPWSPDEEVMFSDSDCSSCHQRDERVVGPSYQEVAKRYALVPRDRAVATLADTIRNGGIGNWGNIPMPPHPSLSVGEARIMAQLILREAGEVEPVETVLPGVERSYETDVLPRPDTLHPSLSIRSIHGGDFTPMVGGLALLPDGRLLVATWDRDGAVYLLDGWETQGSVDIKRFAEGLHEPLGMTVVDGRVFVMQKQEITELIDSDGDNWVEEYRAVTQAWDVTSNFHEFGFGLVHHEGFLYGGLSACIKNGGKSCPEQLPDRGRLFRYSLEDDRLEFIASGVRSPNGFGLGRAGEVFATDNQGDWVPASKLLHVREEAFYGWRPPTSTKRYPAPTPPALWLPHNEVGNSPSQPVRLATGPYKGQWLFGDVYNGGLKRACVEKVDGNYQGSAMHFSGGLSAAVNRLMPVAGGGLIAGEIGNPGNWGEAGKPWYGLEYLEFKGRAAFEPHCIHATADGFSVTLTQAARGGSIAPDDVMVKQWFYYPSPQYGGPKFAPETLSVEAAGLSRDRRRLTLKIPGLREGRVVYLRLPESLRSEDGEPLWVREAWYTLNAIPDPVVPVHNRLTEEEKTEGWQLLFDGETFNGWKNYGVPEWAPVEGWAIENGTLRMTHDRSFFRFVLDYLNPFGHALKDLMTKKRFSEFELSIDWKISEGGNSGIFYLVPDEQDKVPWNKGLEMQVLDNEGHKDGQIHKHRAGDLYDLKASSSEPVNAPGQWNTARIRVEGDRIQHWLNGVKVVDIVRGSEEWRQAMADSKFAEWPDFGTAESGHIVLQDHGDTVWYRNIKIRPLY